MSPEFKADLDVLRAVATVEVKGEMMANLIELSYICENLVRAGLAENTTAAGKHILEMIDVLSRLDAELARSEFGPALGEA
jgi:hypothetical protein